MGGLLSTRFPATAHGSHQAISTMVFRFPEGPQAQIFYPTAATSTPPQHTYMREAAAEGLARWLKKPQFVFSHLTAAAHPAPYRNAVLAPSSSPAGWPTVIFSHGIGGSLEVYTQLSLDLASHGYIVIALEHEDGSGSYAETAKGEPIYYRFPDASMAYQRDNVVEFRRPFLAHRVADIVRVVTYLNSRPADAPDVLGGVDSARLLIAGHSFGAATCVMASNSPQLQGRLLGAMLLDVWPFPIPDDVLDKGCPVPVASILSTQFTESPECAYTRRLLSAETGHPSYSFHLRDSVHQNFADAVHWFPEWLGRKMKLTGGIKVSEARDAVVATTATFFRKCLEDSGRGTQSDFTSADMLAW